MTKTKITRDELEMIRRRMELSMWLTKRRSTIKLSSPVGEAMFKAFQSGVLVILRSK